MLRKLVVIGITVFILISCATSPLGRKQFKMMPSDQMSTMGAEAFEQIKQQTPAETNKRINNYVNCIATAIVQVSNSPIKQWETLVFRDDTANAFALPGGKIGVHTGLLNVAKTQHQLAAVVGHEVAHVLADHSNERVSQEFALQQSMTLLQALGSPQSPMGQQLMGLLGLGAQMGVILPYSRKHESEADEMGLYLMAKAGFDPRESIRLWQNMSQGEGEGESEGEGGQPPEFLSTHPSHENRIARLNQIMKRAMQFYQQAKASGKNPRCK